MNALWFLRRPAPRLVHSSAHLDEVAYQAVRRALEPTTTRAIRRDAKAFKAARKATTAALWKSVTT